MNKPLRTIRLVPRSCDCCGSSDLYPVFAHSYTAETRNNSWHFELNNVLCKHCGFAFVSPCFHQDDLNAYYSDSFAALQNENDEFDPQKRRDFIERYSADAQAFVEIGSNRQTEFHTTLRKQFRAVTTVELNDDVDKNSSSLSGMETASVDLLAHYFVFEHVADTVGFITECNRVLKAGGVMIIEVPDLTMFETYPKTLFFFEHTNHFSPTSLQRLVERFGFKLIETDGDCCSRKFGFAASFRKIVGANVDGGFFQPGKTDSEFESSKETIQNAVEGRKRYLDYIRELYQTMCRRSDEGKITIVWGANRQTQALFSEGRRFPSKVRILDSDPRKKTFSDQFEVWQPNESAEYIRQADHLMLMVSEVHHRTILDSIDADFGKQFKPNQVTPVIFSATNAQ